jgi:hypothetical protein
VPDKQAHERDHFIVQAARDLEWFRTFSPRDLPLSAKDWLEWPWQQA